MVTRETPATKAVEAATPWREPRDICASTTQRTFLTEEENVKGPLQPPQHTEASENIQMHRGEWGTYGGVHSGTYKFTGVYKCIRGIQMYRWHPDSPKYEKHSCL